MLSWLGDYYYDFPKGWKLKKRLADVLEKNVDEKYYLPDKAVMHIILSENFVKFVGRVEYKMKDIELIQVGQLQGKFEMANRVYSPDGLCPTITTMQGGRVEPKIIEDFYANRNPRIYEELSPTLRAEKEGLMVVELTEYEPKVIGGIGEKKSNSNTQWYLQDRIYDNNIAVSLATSANPYYLDRCYRIRKLIHKECWRLMGFDDESFHRAEQVNSNSQLYKQAGNSIVVPVLEAIFKNLF